MKAVDFIYEEKSYTISFDQYYRLSLKNSESDLDAYDQWIRYCQDGRDFMHMLTKCMKHQLGEFDKDNCRNKTDAKTEFFLEASDLSGILYETFSGERSRYYHVSVLNTLAERKYGKAGFAEKLHKREQKQLKDRRKTAEAENALNSMTNQLDRLSLNGRQSWGTYLNDDESLKKIRKEVMKELKSNMTLDMLMKKRGLGSSSKSAAGYETPAIHIPNVQKAEFAALIGRPDDSALKTLVKKGAWYNQEVECNAFFNSNLSDGTPITGKGKHNDIVGMYPNEDLTVKFKPCNGTLSIKARVHYLG